MQHRMDSRKFSRVAALIGPTTPQVSRVQTCSHLGYFWAVTLHCCHYSPQPAQIQPRERKKAHPPQMRRNEAKVPAPPRHVVGISARQHVACNMSIHTGVDVHMTEENLLHFYCEEIGAVEFTEVMAVDPKPSAFKFHCQNGPQPLHHFGTFAEVLMAGKAFCKIHNDNCKVPKKPSCFIAGFPCAPFSSQRSNRAAKGQDAQS
eukprot:4748299-Amphidinium_carterae.3